MKTVKIFLIGLLTALLLNACSSQNWQEKLTEGRSYMERGDYSAAAVAYAAAVDAAPERPEGYLGRGDARAALANRADTENDTREANRRAALSDYRRALELDGKNTEARQKLTSLYLLLGSEALAAGRNSDTISDLDADSAAATSDGSSVVSPDTAAYDLAESYYRAALALQDTSAEIYGRLADVLLLRGNSEQAVELLERGVVASHDSALSARLEALKDTLSRQEDAERRVAAMEALSAYYGDPAACRMTAEQARAYAQLLADGLSGKFTGFSGYGKPLYSYPVYWDEPYPVMGAGSYETDRARVLLGDFAGDGNPYLLAFSSLTEGESFEIYGWTGGKAALCAGIECYGGNREAVLAVREDGTVLLEESWPVGENARAGQTWHFQGGTAAAVEIWSGVWNPDADTVRVRYNGEENTYTTARWNALRSGGGQDAAFSWPSLKEAMKTPASLREMIEALNAYAAAISAGESVPVALPPAHSERHRMAAAMLRKLYALDRISIDSSTRLALIRLLDLDGDGTEELIAVFDGIYRAENGTPCQFALYRWGEEGLQEIPGAAGLSELRLVRENRQSGILGIGPLSAVEGSGSNTGSGAENGNGTGNGGGMTEAARRYVYTFLSRSEELRANPDTRRYAIVRDGAVSGITEAEYTAVRGRYQELDRLADFAHLPEKRNYEETVAALYRKRDTG